MKLRKDKIIITTLASALLLITPITALAASDKVTFHFIDSNQYTKMISVTKSSDAAYASATINKFYKDDGTPTTSYDELYVQCGSSGEQAASVLCKTGTAKRLTLKGTYNQKGKVLTFYGMGHDPALDCYVDAVLDADVS